jgi:putative membrane-bound dehydrogenase-like protein
MSCRLALAWLLVIAVASEARSEPALPKVPDGFKAELVLQAPEIEAPTALCVAPNGDVYFAEDPMDMRGPPTKNIDKIWLLKGGDPKKKVLFAEKMWAVMGLEIVRDKLYVVHAPYVSVFTLDADGKATKREDLFSDLGPPVAGVPSFNDHIPSGIRMGMDGWLYVSIGDKGIPKMTRKETDQGSVHVAEGRWRHSKYGHYISLEGGGVIRFRPDGSGLEVFASGTRNHLDVPLDEHDRIFVRDNTDDGLGWWTRLMYLPHGAFMGYPWAYTKHKDETLPMVRDFGGGAPCGGFVYCDDGLPETYRGRVFHCEWGQGKVFAVKLAPDGAGFKFVDQITFMDPGREVKDFRPFTLRPTADGRGFYVTDWGYGGWLTDKKVGRLWRVTYTKDDVKPALRGKDSDSVEELIRALDHPAHSERLRAQRELMARGKNAARALELPVTGSLVRDKGEKAELPPRALRHALWVLPIAGGKWVNSVERMTQHPDSGVRLEAVRVLESYGPRVNGIHPPSGSGDADDSWAALALALRIEHDADPQVRLHAALALKGWSDEYPLKALANEKDPLVRFALVRGMKQERIWSRLPDRFEQSPNFKDPSAMNTLIAALAEEYDTSAVALLRQIGASQDAALRRSAVETLARVYKDRKPYPGTWWGTQPAGRKPPAREVAWEGTPSVREAILAALKDTDAPVRKAAVTALVEMKDPETLDPIVKQFAAENDPATRVDLVRAASSLASQGAGGFLAGVVRDRKNAEVVRLEAISGLEAADSDTTAEVLAKAAVPAESVAIQVRALEALGSIKSGDVSGVAKSALKSAEPAVRKAAVSALAARKGDYAALLIPLLEDKSADVRAATARALGTFKDHAAVPALVRAVSDEAAQFDVLAALAQMPDRRALSAYLIGLGSRNVDLRKASAAALTAVREEVVPDLEQLVKRNEVRAELLPELRNIYAAFIPVLDWKLIGPFPDDHKPHPPEMEQKFDAVYRSLDQDVRWAAKHGDGKNHGFVNLDPIFRPNTNVVAYGYAEVVSDADRDATLLLGSDDTIAVWVNGKLVHHFDGDRGWAFDQSRVNVRLVKGVNYLLVRCGNHSGPWGYSLAVSGDLGRYAFLKGGVQKFDLETFRVFARKNAGDAARGKKLFLDVKGLACVKCHALGGEGGRVGPDLAGIALKYKREDLMTSVLEPSKTIAQGYETIVLTLANGKTLTGVFKGESADSVSLADAEGKSLVVPKKDIDERFFSPLSTMPNGLNEGMTLQDFADVIAFLEERREEKVAPKK